MRDNSTNNTNVVKSFRKSKRISSKVDKRKLQDRIGTTMLQIKFQKILFWGTLLLCLGKQNNANANSISQFNYVQSKSSYNANDSKLNLKKIVVYDLRGGSIHTKTTQSLSSLKLHSSSPVMHEKIRLINTTPRGGGKAMKMVPSSQSKIQTAKPSLNLIRLIFLCFYGSLGVLLPYLPVYYHSLGHGGMYIGLLGAVKPLTTFLVAPAWGILSDRTQAHSTILQYTFVIGVLLQISVCFNDSIVWLVTTVFLSALINAPVKSLMDNMVINTLPSEDKSQYGKMRLWGQVGFGAGSSGIGVLLHKSMAFVNSATGSPESTTTAFAMVLEWIQHNVLSKLTGYRIAFLAHGILSIPTLICMQLFRSMERKSLTVKSDSSGSKKEGTKIVQGLNHLIHNGDAIFFFFLVFVVGVSSGCIENFAYVRMREVGGTGRDMGFSRLVSSAAGGPMFWFSGSLSKIFGEETILVLSLLSYVARFFIYALMKHPLQGLPAEALRGLTFAAFWSTGTIYAHKISPPGMTATMVRDILIRKL